MVESAAEVGTFTVHFIDKGDSWNVIFVCLSPDGFALGFDSFAGGEDDDSAVEDAEGAFDFGGEIDVTGRVDEIECVSFPVEGYGGGLNGDTAFLFFGIVVGNGRTLIDHSDFVYEVGIEEHSFRNGGLTRIDMGNDADVAESLQFT